MAAFGRHLPVATDDSRPKAVSRKYLGNLGRFTR